MLSQDDRSVIVVSFRFMNQEGATPFHRLACSFAKSVKESTTVTVTAQADRVDDLIRLAERYGGGRR